MLEPYRLIVVSTISLFLLLAGILLYKYVYPKKDISYPVLLLLFSILPLISILRKGTYESGGLSIYVGLAYNFIQNLLSGVFIPQWAPYLCAHYGCPDFIYMYPLPFYLVSLFYFLGFSLIGSIKALIITTFLVSGFAMYVFMNKFIDKKYAFSAAILYLFAPYHLVNLHFQIDIAEMSATALLPLNFLLTYYFVTSNKEIWKLLFTLSISLLIISHPVISIASLPFLFVFGLLLMFIINPKTKKQLIKYILSFLLGIMAASYYWLPAMIESKYILWGQIAKTSITPISMMLYSPWRFGFLFQGPIGQLSFFLGFAHWIAVVIAIIYLLHQWQHLKKHALLVYFVGSFLLLFISISEIGTPIWDLPILKSFQMTYRLLVHIAFFTACIGGIVLSKLQNKLLWYVIIFLAISTTILNWGNRRPIPEIDDNYLINELMFKPPFGMDLTFPKWTEFNQNYNKQLPTKRIEVLSGEAEINQIKFLPTIHQYVINAKTQAVIVENTFYYPGWSVYLNNKKIPITYNKPTLKGIITFNLSKGLHLVEVKFEQTTTRVTGRIISIFAIIGAIIFINWSMIRKKIRTLFDHSPTK